MIGVLSLKALEAVLSLLGLNGAHVSSFAAAFPLVLAAGATMLKPRRGRIEITAELLEIASGQGATKTALVYRANLNFTLVQRYLLYLESKGMIERVDGGSPALYRTTEKGKETLGSINSALKAMLEKQTEVPASHF